MLDICGIGRDHHFNPDIKMGLELGWGGILRKLEGRFEDGLKGNLVKLEKLILSEFDKADFSDTLQTIARLKRKLL